jgi:hypothetical protein
MGENQHYRGHAENKADATSQNQARPRRQPEILIGSVFMQICTFLWSHPIGGLSFTLAMLCFTLGPLASGINDARRTWWYALGIWFFLGGIIYFVFDHEISKRMSAAPSTQSAQISPQLEATFKQLRHSFELLALQSKGLHHVLTEHKQGAWLPKSAHDNPPGVSVSGPATDPRVAWSINSPPSDPMRPRALTDDERAADPPKTENEAYIRDARGHALAIWEPGIVRFGYILGDHAVLQQFENIANAAGSALRGVPDDVVSRLPEPIRSLFRPRVTVGRMYAFGAVPPERPQWMQRGWQPMNIVFENGVIVQHVEPETGGSSPSSVWLLLLHRMGWAAPTGSPLRASRWYWQGNHSVSISFPANDPMVANVPRDRLYSVLGPDTGSGADICWASVWGIDRLLALMAPA